MAIRAQVIVQSQGTVGPPGLQWKGNYVSTDSYNLRDLVRDDDNNIIYIVVKQVAANSGFLLTNKEYFEVFSIQLVRAPGMQWRGTFDENIDYAARDLVLDTTSNNVYIFNRAISRSETVDFSNAATADLVLKGSTVTESDITALNALAPYSTSLNTLAPQAANIGTVAPAISDVSAVSGKLTEIETVATNLNQANNASEVVIVGDNIADVNTVATSINDSSSAINTAATNASDAATSAGDASASATAASGSAGAAATSESNANVSYVDADKIVNTAANTQYTLSDSSTGYSALHYAAAAQTLSDDVNDKFIGPYTTSTLPVSGITTGAIAYDQTTQKLVVWSGSTWEIGLEGNQGPSGAGISTISYDAFLDTLSIVYDQPGTTQSVDPRIGNGLVDFGSHVVRFSNSFPSLSNFPSAFNYPGMIAVAADTGKLYVSKIDTSNTAQGGWFEVAFASTTPALVN
ncbi:MAG: hypothetical protein CL429_00860 [Acidimicrobiaceae bacterium]|nr:hypothetical protein [Acidimicrobiaceae bacterium]